MNEERKKKGVSIPFRYAENLASFRVPFSLVKFQFLLGTLKTRFNDQFSWCAMVFQFLLGTLKTALRNDSREPKKGSFNSF